MTERESFGLAGSKVGKIVFLTVSVLMIAVWISRFLNFYLDEAARTFSEFDFTEFLVNYEGGFVRRGLIGQLLIEFCRLTGSGRPYIPVLAACLAVYALTLFLFVRQFLKRRLNWWILLTTLMFGFTTDIVRKDFLQLLILICVLWLLRADQAGMWRKIAATVLTAVSLLIHEVYIFWGVPVYLLLLADGLRSRGLRNAMPYLLPLLLLFLTLVRFKGGSDQAWEIQHSWHELASEQIGETPVGTVGSLEWELLPTVKGHILKNLGHDYDRPAKDPRKLAVLLFHVFFMLASWYLVRNIFRVFRTNGSNFKKEDETSLSSLYIIALLCLLPMFLGLSCDLGRIYFYAVSSVVAAYVFLPSQGFSRIVPAAFRRRVSLIDSKADTILKPTPILILTLLLLIGISPYDFGWRDSFGASVVGQICNLWSMMPEVL